MRERESRDRVASLEPIRGGHWTVSTTYKTSHRAHRFHCATCRELVVQFQRALGARQVTVGFQWFFDPTCSEARRMASAGEKVKVRSRTPPKKQFPA